MPDIDEDYRKADCCHNCKHQSYDDEGLWCLQFEEYKEPYMVCNIFEMEE